MLSGTAARLAQASAEVADDERAVRDMQVNDLMTFLPPVLCLHCYINYIVILSIPAPPLLTHYPPLLSYRRPSYRPSRASRLPSLQLLLPPHHLPLHHRHPRIFFSPFLNSNAQLPRWTKHMQQQQRERELVRREDPFSYHPSFGRTVPGPTSFRRPHYP